MFIACVIVSVLLAFVAFGSAMGKLNEVPQVTQMITHVGAIKYIRQLAFLEIAGAIGLIVGLFIAPIGIAAAAGLTLYFLGAVIAHLRVHDPIQHIMAPGLPLLLSIAALLLRINTM